MDQSLRTKARLETVEPIGRRVLIRKDEDRHETRGGIALPDSVKIPVLTGRVVAMGKPLQNDPEWPVRLYDKVLVNPSKAIPADFEHDNRLFVVSADDIVAVLRRD